MRGPAHRSLVAPHTIARVPSPFAVRLRAYAAAHFELDQHLVVRWPDATAILQTEYTGGSSGRAYPVTMFGEIRGVAKSLDEAQNRLGGSLGNVLPIVALAANAAIADPFPIGAFGLDMSRGPQEFMWYAVPHARTFFPPGVRKINGDATLALMSAIGTHPQTGILHRAAECYRRALDNWVPERMLMAGEFPLHRSGNAQPFLGRGKIGREGNHAQEPREAGR